MPKSKSHKKKRQPKRVLALPDLEHAKAAVLNSLTSASGQRIYDQAGAPLDPYVAPDSPEADESGHYPRSCWIERIVVERDGLEILHRHI